MKREIVDRLDELFADEPFMKGAGVDGRQIDEAQRALGVSFSEGYREFLAKYGGALVGPYPVYGLARAQPMDERLWSVVAVTNHFRKQAWPGTDRWYVISMDHAGNPVGIDERGKALTYDHDAGEMIEVAADFESYLARCLSNL